MPFIRCLLGDLFLDRVELSDEREGLRGRTLLRRTLLLAAALLCLEGFVELAPRMRPSTNVDDFVLCSDTVIARVAIRV